MCIFDEQANMSVEMGSNDGRSASGGETVAAVDRIDGRPHLVVADISCDDAWMAVTESEAVAVGRQEREERHDAEEPERPETGRQQRDERERLPGDLARARAGAGVGVGIAVLVRSPRRRAGLGAGVLGHERRTGDGEAAADREHEEHEREGEAQRPDGLRGEPPQPQRVGDVVGHLQQLGDDDGPRQPEERPRQAALCDGVLRGLHPREHGGASYVSVPSRGRRDGSTGVAGGDMRSRCDLAVRDLATDRSGVATAENHRFPRSRERPPEIWELRVGPRVPRDDSGLANDGACVAREGSSGFSVESRRASPTTRSPAGQLTRVPSTHPRGERCAVERTGSGKPQPP
jgi:hypothetical protein